jgi:Mlc titration factor MtfA (ptsG expression regulator)/RimJ/RimL family protein N-acetyltransferase
MPGRAKQNAFTRDLLARPFSEEWKAWLSANMAHYRLLGDAERARLQDDARVLIAEKTWEGCDGLKVTEMMKLTVAAQAALLLLGLDHDYFSRVLSIVLFPTAFQLPAESWEERGSFASGRAVNYGTVFLAWETVLAEARDSASGHNLVIHEFAHQLDFLDGYTNGVPVLRSRDQTRRWQLVMQGTFQRLRRELQQGRRTFLGTYAATNPTEFFSVASEKFFCLPAQLHQSHRELFDVLAEYYRVDPVGWFEGKAGARLPPAQASAVKDPAGQQAHAPPALPAFESGFIDFTCPYCGNTISFPGSEAGTLKQCPNCLESMIVPDCAGRPAERIPLSIRTERLVLRRFETVDARDISELLSNPHTLRYLTWTCMSLQDAEEWIAWQRRVLFPQSRKYCYLAIETRQNASVAGLATFWFVGDEFDLAQFEIIIHPDWQRRGYATEAIGGLLTYAFSGFHARRVVAECDARNAPARRLLLRAGLRQESECIQDRFVKGEWVNTVGFALLRQEYDTQNGSGGAAAKDSTEA